MLGQPELHSYISQSEQTALHAANLTGLRQKNQVVPSA